MGLADAIIKATEAKNALALSRYSSDLAKSQRDLQFYQAQNAPEYYKAQAGLLGQQAKYYGPDTESQIALRGAQTNLAGAETKFMPLKYAIDAQNAKRGNERFGSSFQLAKMLNTMPEAARDTWIAQNQGAYIQMVNDLANKAADDRNTNKNNVLDYTIKQAFPNAQNDALTLSDDDQQKLVNAGIAKPTGLLGNIDKPVLSNNPPSFNSNQDDIAAQRLATQMAANNKLTTNQGRKQAESAAKLDNWLAEQQPQYASAISNMSKYAGIIGKGKKYWDGLQNTNPQAYKDYQWFINTFRVSLDALITQMEETSVTAHQQDQYKKMASDAFDNFTTDPKSSIEQVNRLMGTLDSISKQRINQAQPLFKNTYKEAFGYQGIPTPYVDTESTKLKTLAQEAINKGADPQKVNERLQQQLNTLSKK